MGLSISRTDIKLEYQTTPGKLSIETKDAVLEIHQKFPKIQIESQKPMVVIDQSEAFSTSGLKSYRDLTREFAQRGIAQAVEYTGKKAEEGDALANIPTSSNPIAEMAAQYEEHVFDIDTMPKAGPKIDVVGKLNINFENNGDGVDFNYLPYDVNINYFPGKVNIYVKQYPDVTINYTGNKFDKSI